MYQTETEQGIFEQVLHGDLDFSSDPWPSISESAKDLVRRMLVRDPRRRLTAHEVLCEFFSVVFSFCSFNLRIIGFVPLVYESLYLVMGMSETFIHLEVHMSSDLEMYH